MQRKIQTLTEDLPVEVLLVRRSREQREKILLNAQRETLSELRVEEVFARRLAHEEVDEARRTELNELFAQTLHSMTRTKTHENSEPASEKSEFAKG